MTDDRDAAAAEYVLAVNAKEQRSQTERRLDGDRALLARVQAWERRLVSAFGCEAGVCVPDRVWQGIEQRIAEQQLPKTVTVRANASEWLPVMAGVDKRRLAVDAGGRFETSLLRLAPGARVPTHEHRATEECFVLAGELSIGGLILKPGDYHRAGAGSIHPDAYSPSGALVFLRAPLMELEASRR